MDICQYSNSKEIVLNKIRREWKTIIFERAIHCKELSKHMFSMLFIITDEAKP